MKQTKLTIKPRMYQNIKHNSNNSSAKELNQDEMNYIESLKNNSWKNVLVEALRISKGNKCLAAYALKINRNTLHRHLVELDINYKDYRTQGDKQ